MNRVAWLESKIHEVSVMLAQSEVASVQAAASPFAQISNESMRSHLAELKHDLYLAKSERAREVVTMRLVGSDLDKGAIPLHLLSRVASYFERAMGYASYRIQHGKEAKRKVPDSIQRILDLRLADVAFGSTELVITGNTQPDLVGGSLLESSLELTFELLTSPENLLAERAAVAGPMAARMVGLLLGEFERERCGVDMRWVDSSDVEHRWQAALVIVSTVRSKLMQLAESPPETVVIDGVVELLSTTGRIVIRPNGGGDKISARFPRDLYQRVQDLHLGAQSRFELILNRLFNPNTLQDVVNYTLVSFGNGGTDGDAIVKD
ncbi:hypothetical protein M8R20_26740 [Pseudomonas sp. R2.Fl]|nr:hypothetical protein [Pseudomonas sp. R2.Fl]